MPAYKKLIQNAVQKAFEKQLGDIAGSLTYKSVTTNYLPDDGGVTETETTVSLKGTLLDDAKTRITEGGGVITAPVKKALLPALSLGSISPKGGDRIQEADGTQWVVDAVAKDPVSALYTLYLRRP